MEEIQPESGAVGLESTIAQEQEITPELETTGASEAPADTLNQPPAAAPPTLPIHLLGSRALRDGTMPVVEITDEIKALAEVMVHTMINANGVGLAAPQVGVGLRIFTMIHHPEKRVLRLANPQINSTEGEQEFVEGCLSQPGLSVTMKRPKYIAVQATDIETGQQVIVEATDLEAAILSHEMDHLNGKLIIDTLSRIKRDMYKAKLRKNIKRHDRAEAAQRAQGHDHRDHPHFTEPKR